MDAENWRNFTGETIFHTIQKKREYNRKKDRNNLRYDVNGGRLQS